MTGPRSKVAGAGAPTLEVPRAEPPSPAGRPRGRSSAHRRWSERGVEPRLRRRSGPGMPNDWRPAGAGAGGGWSSKPRRRRPRARRVAPARPRAARRWGPRDGGRWSSAPTGVTAPQAPWPAARAQEAQVRWAERGVPARRPPRVPPLPGLQWRGHALVAAPDAPVTVAVGGPNGAPRPQTSPARGPVPMGPPPAGSWPRYWCRRRQPQRTLIFLTRRRAQTGGNRSVTAD